MLDSSQPITSFNALRSNFLMLFIGLDKAHNATTEKYNLKGKNSKCIGSVRQP